jgi:hypothetical protein
MKMAATRQAAKAKAKVEEVQLDVEEEVDGPPRVLITKVEEEEKEFDIKEWLEKKQKIKVRTR